MRKQQIDPIAQAMQILQLVTQRQGQQAGIEQANRGLDLQEANQRQQAQEFQLRQKQLAAEEAFRNRSLAVDEPYKKAMTEQVQKSIDLDKSKTDAMVAYHATKNAIDLLANTPPTTLEEATVRQQQMNTLLKHLYTLTGVSPLQQQASPLSQYEKNILKTIK